MPKPIRIEYKELVRIPSVDGDKVDKLLLLWSGITGKEYFPATGAAAFYHLVLEKNVPELQLLRTIHEEVSEAFRALARAWPFAGGSHMRPEVFRVTREERFESNAGDVEASFLREQGVRKVTASFPASVDISATYKRPPLEPATRICREAQSDPTLDRLLQYHHAAYAEGPRWWAELYKIRDALSNEFGGEQSTRNALGISRSDWQDFGKTLNRYDLRHAPDPGDPISDRKDIEGDLRRAKRLGDEWVRKYVHCRDL